MNGRQAKQIRKTLGFIKDPENKSLEYAKLKKLYKFLKKYVHGVSPQHRNVFVKEAGKLIENKHK